MHIYTAVGICIVFLGLMGTVIVNQTLNVINELKKFTSSVEIISLTVPQKPSILGLKATYINETSFDISEYCNCLLVSADSQDDQECSFFTTTRTVSTGGSEPEKTEIFLLTAGPMNWEERETTEFTCKTDFTPLISYLVEPSKYGDLVTKYGTDKGNKAIEGLDPSIFQSPLPWINFNTINQVLLSRENHYSEDKLTKSYIKTTVSQGSHEQENVTKITFAWREGQVTKVSNSKSGNLWSIATLMCTVLLGLERCVAFINRAKNKTPKAKITKVDQAPMTTQTPGPDSVTKIGKTDKEPTSESLAWSTDSMKPLNGFAKK